MTWAGNRAVRAMMEEESLSLKGSKGPGEIPLQPIPGKGFEYAALLPRDGWQVDGDGELEPGLAPRTGSQPANEWEQADPNAIVHSHEPIPLRRIVEAMLFLGGEPLTVERACMAVRGLTPIELMQTIDALNADYRVQGRPYRIRPWRSGYELALRPHFVSLAEKLQGATREARLAPSAIDVLALVAYRQPIAKQDVDSLRGAESGGILRQLVRRGLLAVVHDDGDSAIATRYRTTQRFLDLFHLRGPEDLPMTGDLPRL